MLTIISRLSKKKSEHLNRIDSSISRSLRCPSINEYFDAQTINFSLLRRIKYYHLPCQQHHDLVCFHDSENYLCLSNEHHQANCFDFDFSMSYNCHGLNDCQNDDKCFQEDPTCPLKSLCVCQQCFYGSKCQFSTKGFDLSLDSILGYRIRPQTRLSQQSSAVKISIVISSVGIFLGLINENISSMTFQRRKIREVDFAIYLHRSSIVSLFVILIFTLTFCFLLFTQIGIIANRFPLRISCILLNILLRSLLTIEDWFHACVAVERSFIVFKGISFDKERSRILAKRIVFIVIFLISCSLLHDSIHRRLINDDEEQKVWCVVQYSSITTFHFVVPFLINLFLAILIILSMTTMRHRSTLKRKQTYKEN